MATEGLEESRLFLCCSWEILSRLDLNWSIFLDRTSLTLVGADIYDGGSGLSVSGDTKIKREVFGVVLGGQ